MVCGKKTYRCFVCYEKDHSRNHLDYGELSFKDQILQHFEARHVNPHSCENFCVTLPGNDVLLKWREVMLACMCGI